MKQYSPLALLALFCVIGCNRREQKAEPVTPEIVAKENAAKATGEKQEQKAPPTEQFPAKGKEEASSGSGDLLVTKRTAEGVGATDDESLKDAFRKAIWQEVGVVVDAETIVKNDALISDKILSYADGIVKTYKVVRTRKEHGLVWTTIEADVERRSVIAKVKQADLPVRKLDGKGIAAQALTDFEAAKNATLLLDKALEGFPLNVLEGLVSKPEIISRNEKSLQCRFHIVFRVSPERYDQYLNKLQNTLQVIAKQRGERRESMDLSGQLDQLDNLAVFPRPRNTHTLFVNYACGIETFGSYKQGVTHWKYYVLDDLCIQSFAKCKYPVTAHLRLLTKDGKDVVSRTLTPSISPLYGPLPDSSKQANALRGYSLIHPRFGGPKRFWPTVNVDQDITLTHQQWETVESTRCELARAGAK